MELPHILLLLIGVVIACATFVIAAMNRRREHALRDRFADEYERIPHDRSRGDRFL